MGLDHKNVWNLIELILEKLSFKSSKVLLSFWGRTKTLFFKAIDLLFGENYPTGLLVVDM
jgi:hypothetical protein